MYPPLRGSLRVFVQYDVCEQIDLEKVRALLGAQDGARQPAFKHPAPGYVRFERSPVVQQLEPLTLGSGERFERQLKFFDYGVISVELDRKFEGDWDQLVHLSSRWIAATEIETRSEAVVRAHLKQFAKAVEQPYKDWLSEDYYVIQLNQALDERGQALSGDQLLQLYGPRIAQIVRGEYQPLSLGEQKESLQASLSYYPCDLLVVGWLAALVYDTPEGAAPTIQLLEYANTQLLEFRYYDGLLTRVLANVYRYLERRGGIFRRWRMAGEAERLNAIALDIRELAERTDNAIKFLSDMFYARAYRIASERVGVTDYHRLVEEKLRTAGELYEYMIDEFHQGRAFVLEALVVVILIIELVNLFVRR